MESKKWSKEEIEYLKEHYPKTPNPRLTLEINNLFHHGQKVRTLHAVEHKGRYLGLKKDFYSRYHLNDLSERVKQILHYKQIGYSDREIADILQIPEGSVKSHYSYAGKHFKFDGDLLTQLSETINLLKNENNILRNQLKNVTYFGKYLTGIINKYLPAFERIPKKSVFPKITPRRKEEVVILELGDLHYGEKVMKKDTANLGEFNKEIFVIRLQRLFSGIMECLSIQRSQIPIQVMEINCLGDFVTGENIYLGQQRAIDTILIDQAVELSTLLAQYLVYPLIQYGDFKKIRFRCVWGNHGRIGKKEEFHMRSNFDYLLYILLKKMFEKQPEVEFYISESPFMLYEIPEVPEFTHLLLHGDEIRSWMSIPYYAIDRTFMRYVQLVNKPIHFMHIGHSHNKATIDVPYGEKIINGSFIGATDFSVKKMQLFSQPKQLLFGFNHKYGKTWSYDIRLEEIHKLVPIKGVYTPVFEK